MRKVKQTDQLRYTEKEPLFTLPDDGTYRNCKNILCEDESAKYPVFVYGTLKKGFFNNKRIFNDQLGESTYVNTGYTKDRSFDFWSMQGVYPAIVAKDSGPKFRAGGEIYIVDEGIMMALDIMEFNYRRCCLPMITSNGEEMWCWVYVLSENNTKSGDWTQDDRQIKFVDDKLKVKIWGGEWATEDTYKRTRYIMRPKDMYQYPK